MAAPTDKYISGKLIFLSVNQGTEEEPDWEVVACTTEDGLSVTVDGVNRANKCEGDFVANLPTDVSWEFTSTADAVRDAELESGQVSYDTIFDITVGKEMLQWKIATAEEDYYRMGYAYVSSLSEAAPSADYLTFDITLTGSGVLTSTPPTT